MEGGAVAQEPEDLGSAPTSLQVLSKSLPNFSRSQLPETQ